MFPLPTSKITSGTFAESFLTNATTDLQPLKSDITALALREATNESSASFNLPNQQMIYLDFVYLRTIRSLASVLRRIHASFGFLLVVYAKHVPTSVF